MTPYKMLDKEFGFFQKNKEELNDLMSKDNGIIEPDDEDFSDYEDFYKQEYEDKKDFLEWEEKVQRWYIENFLPYWSKLSIGWWECDGYSFWEIDSDILTKALQNDIRLLLKNLWEWYNGEIKIKFRNGRPEFMSSQFESINDEWEYEKLKAMVWNFGFVTHKRYWINKKLYGEKIYRYTDKNWWVEGESWHRMWYVPKKKISLKKK